MRRKVCGRAGRGGGGRGFTKSSSETDGEEIEVWRGGDRGGGREKLAC